EAFFFSSRRRHTRFDCDWSSDVCSSDLVQVVFMMNGPLGGICMLRDARALGYKPIWTGVGVSWNLNVVAQASGGGADGIRTLSRSEERRVGKECRWRWAAVSCKQKGRAS